MTDLESQHQRLPHQLGLQPNSGFPLFPLCCSDKIPWLFQYFLPFSSIFLMFCFFNWTFDPFLQIMQSSFKYQIIFISIDLSFPAFCVIFPDFSSLFKFTDFFLTWKCLPIFPGFPVWVGTLQPFLERLAWYIKKSKQLNQSNISSDIAALTLTFSVNRPLRQHFVPEFSQNATNV